ncbi:spore germination protein [Paenibacillus alkalitolerans]|uniref:spore germination protein n=1 Tax=Paenibacillus alkalitolerans TaxID=2799335 RepID=UPI0018F27F05|nr:spore germination protein [Paenibacillus alkalitolerans]
MSSFIKMFKKTSKQPPLKPTIQPQSPQGKEPIEASLAANLQKVKQATGNSGDVIIREFEIGDSGQLKAAVIYTDGLADSKAISDFILESFMFDAKENGLHIGEEPFGQDVLKRIKSSSLAIGEIKEATDFEMILNAVLSGDTAILIDGQSVGIVSGTKGWKDRGVTEPSSQTVVRGPREGFSESLRTNTALIRRKIKDSNLWLESMQVGRVTKTDVALMYIKGIVNDEVLQEVRTRLQRIQIDGILESGNIEELIQDDTFTPFPTVFHSERPDTIASGLLEGRVAILVDGTPFVLLVPALFAQFFQASEDYYQRADFASVLRIVRYICFFIALMAPSLYIAITTFHQELLPSGLLIGLAAQREGVPFPAFVEALLMEITFEILREAGVRMPRAIGQSVSIVGTLVIGQAAVEAGLVSAAMVIVVAITAISNFVFPAFNMAISIRMLRFPLMGLAASFGLYGITIGLIALILHLCSLRSFGVPYMSPFAPFIATDQRDAIFRFPLWSLSSRPRLISQKNIIRENTDPPSPERGK